MVKPNHQTTPIKVATTAIKPPAPPSDVHSRKARIGILTLLVATVVFAAAALFIRYRLESFRANIEENLEARMGVTITMGTVSVNGFHGLRIDNVEMRVAPGAGPSTEIKCPVAFIHLDLNDLVYGKLSVDRVVLNNLLLRVERPLDQDWYTEGDFDLNRWLPLESSDAFRITGREGILMVRNVVGDTELVVRQFGFDISRLVDASDVNAHLRGNLGGDSRKSFDVQLSLASMEDFYFKIYASDLTAEDVNVFLPARHRLVMAGNTSPTLWINGRPDKTLLVSLEAPFAGLIVRDQPDFLNEATGTLAFQGTYSTDAHELSIISARAESDELDGLLEGSVKFGEMYPEFDLELTATRMPAASIIDYAFEGQLNEFGEVTFDISEPHELLITLQGTSDEPRFSGRGRAAGGHLVYTPDNSAYPAFELTLGAVDGTWDSTTGEVMARLAVVDGAIRHPAIDISIDALKGDFVLAQGELRASPINARVTGNDVIGSVYYNAEKDEGELTFNGLISAVQDTRLASSLKESRIEGDVSLRGSVIKKGNVYTIDSEWDGTQATVIHDWWFRKPPGIGATGKLRAALRPGKAADVTFEGEVASTHLQGNAHLICVNRKDNEWQLQKAVATSDHVDISTIGKCLLVPYNVTGGIGTDASFSWETLPEIPDGWTQRIEMTLDRISALANVEGDVTPVVCEGVTLAADVVNNGQNTGAITISARNAIVPPMSDDWLLPLRSDVPEDVPERRWTFSLNSEEISLPPWRGVHFAAQAYVGRNDAGFDSYGADIESGRLDGNYHVNHVEHSYTSDVRWSNIPARYFIGHMGWPTLLTGSVTGNVEYSIDRDDPNTLRGGGEFDVTDGQFSADFLYSQLEGRVENESAALPPSLRFSRLHSEVEFEGDTVRTPILSLESEGIAMEGTGHYIHNGDMNYSINVSVTPDVAEQIPALRDNFNLNGYRLGNRAIQLPFEIDGPTFGPKPRLTELPPASETFVSGALEVTSEAFKVIDSPRRILVDLLKTVGGIMGANK